MPDPKRTDAPERALFWHCQRCGTPNSSASYVTHCLGCGALRRNERAVPAERPVEPKAKAEPLGGTRVLIRPARGRFLLAVSWGYAALVIATLILIRWVGDGWWGVTVLLFLPRWLFLAPVAALAVASGLWRCPWHWALHAAIGLVVAGPLMGLSLPISQLWKHPPAGDRLRLVSYNLSQYPVRAADFRAWLAREKVDVVCLQEGSRSAESTQVLLGEGWHVSREGMIGSRWPIVSEMPHHEETVGGDDRWTGRLERVWVRSPSGVEFLVASAHMPTMRHGLLRFMSGDVSGVRLHTDWWGKEVSRLLSALAEAQGLPMLVAGDFNMPADDSTMASLRSNFQFAFEEAGWGYGYTRPTRYPWVRIDHILAGPEWEITACRVGPDFGSDHLPVIAEAVLTTPPAPAAPAG